MVINIQNESIPSPTASRERVIAALKASKTKTRSMLFCNSLISTYGSARRCLSRILPTAPAVTVIHEWTESTDLCEAQGKDSKLSPVIRALTNGEQLPPITGVSINSGPGDPVPVTYPSYLACI